MNAQISAISPPALLDSDLVSAAINAALRILDIDEWEQRELSATIAHIGECRTFGSVMSLATRALAIIPKSHREQRQAVIAILKSLTDEARRRE